MTVTTSVSERLMLNKLYERYTNLGAGRRPTAQFTPRQSRYIMAEHVRDAAGWAASRSADFIVMDTNPNFTRGLELIGHEVKCSRADWLIELRHPEKSQPFIELMDRWWLVVADERFVKEGELPENWGLLALVEKNGFRELRQIKNAPRLTPIQPPGVFRPDMERRFVAPFMRAVARTAENRIRRAKGQPEFEVENDDAELIAAMFRPEVPAEAYEWEN